MRSDRRADQAIGKIDRGADQKYRQTGTSHHTGLNPELSAPREQPQDATYYANAHVLLHDDNCFRFAAVPDSKATIQLMEPDKSEVPPGAAACAGLQGSRVEP